MSKIDTSKIFIKEACPTSIGGQAIMEGVMMQGPDRIAIAMRMPTGELYLKTKPKAKPSKWMKIPFLRGVVAFVSSLILGMGTLMESADILEAYAPEEYTEEPDKFEKWMTDKFGKKAAWNFLMTMSMILAMVITIVFFVILPTWAVNLLGAWIKSAVVLNLIEGLLRIALFILYVIMIKRVEDIENIFRYHGAEHKSIHCYENNLPLTPENANTFYTLHPRCGTSFLVFVLIVSLLLFSFLGWPSLLWRIASRILLLPVIAGISYELLKWAGRSNSMLVRVLSYPGLMLQKLTTAEPTMEQLEVGLLALKAVLVDKSKPYIEGFVDSEGNLVNEFDEGNFLKNNSATQMKERSNQEVIEENPAESIEKNIEMKTSAEESIYASNSNCKYETPGSVTETKSDNDVLTNRKVLAWGREKLAGITNGDNEALMIFSYVTGLSRSQIITRADQTIEGGIFSEYKRRINERKSGKPLQYVVGTQQFMGLHFRVNPNVLIPRMDTEVLVETVVNLIGERIDRGDWREPAILDMCTGSGCIGISLASRFPHAKLVLSDLSEGALTTAAENARINNVFESCEFLLGNMFNTIQRGRRFHIITCNPPYIESATIETLDTEVKDYEPRIALNGGRDGLDYYRVIADRAHDYLMPGGMLALEIGCNQAEAVKQLLETSGYYQNVSVMKDLAGLDRVIIANRY